MKHSYKSYTDSELALLISEGVEGAYAEIYDRYAGLLYVHARKQLSDREFAKDLVQDVFAAIWNNRAGFQKGTNIVGYLYAAVRYKMINWVVRNKRFAAYEAEARADTAILAGAADHLVRERQLRKLIEAEIEQLPAKMREVFLMSREQHLSHKEIADQLNLSPTTVKKQVNNALKLLRVKLETFLAVFLLMNL